MKQRIIIPLSCFAVVVILLFLLFQVYSLRSEVGALRQQLDQAEASIQSNGDQIRLASENLEDLRNELVPAPVSLSKGIHGTSSWQHGSYWPDLPDGQVLIHLYLIPEENAPVSQPGDIASLALRLTNSSGAQLALLDMTRDEAAQEDGSFHYTADITSYAQGENYALDCWPILTTEGGVILTSENPAVSIEMVDGDPTGNCGSVFLVPETE